MKLPKDKHDLWGSMHGIASIGERGQLVVPKSLRKSLEIKKGDKFVVMEKHGAIVLLPTDVMQTFISDLTNQLKNAENDD